jgi:hypothetical protein
MIATKKRFGRYPISPFQRSLSGERTQFVIEIAKPAVPGKKPSTVVK